MSSKKYKVCPDAHYSGPGNWVAWDGISFSRSCAGGVEVSPSFHWSPICPPTCGIEPIWKHQALPPSIWSLASLSRPLHPPQETGNSGALTRVFPQHKPESDFPTLTGIPLSLSLCLCSSATLLSPALTPTPKFVFQDLALLPEINKKMQQSP